MSLICCLRVRICKFPHVCTAKAPTAMEMCPPLHLACSRCFGAMDEGSLRMHSPEQQAGKTILKWHAGRNLDLLNVVRHDTCLQQPSDIQLGVAFGCVQLEICLEHDCSAVGTRCPVLNLCAQDVVLRALAVKQGIPVPLPAVSKVRYMLQELLQQAS